MSGIYVDICPPELNIAEPWENLAQRAPVNVFLHPAALNAVHATNFANVHMLLAWDKSAVPQRLVGVWALQNKKIAPLWSAFLSAPPYKYAFVSSPMVDPEFMGEVIPAFFDAIAAHPRLPKVIRLKYLDGESETYEAIQKALGARGNQRLKLSERARPFVSREFGQKRAGSTRKKLRQDWNRLSALGTVNILNDRTPGGVLDAFEVFLAMEVAGWKGAGGTALLCDTEDAIFARRLVGDLAARQNASVALLRVDGRPIAAQVLLYCGKMAYTWNTAFDPEYGKYSPGALLVDKVTDQLFAKTDIDAIESCSPEGSFMAQLWDGRRATIDMLVDVGTKKSFGFVLAAIGERGYAQLRTLRNKFRSLPWPLRPKRSSLAVSP
jgi:hypothetical protein